MDLFCKGTSRAVDAGVVHAAQHEHLVVRLVAETAVLVDLVVHYAVITIKYKGRKDLSMNYWRTLLAFLDFFALG